MRIGFRTRLMLGTTSLVATFVVVAVVTLALLTEHYVDTQANREVEESRQGFRLQMDLLSRSFLRETVALARSPVLLATVAIEGVDTETLSAALDEVAAPLVTIVAPSGVVLASRDGWRPGTSLHAAPGFEALPTDGPSTHVWPCGTGLAIVAVAPLAAGDELLGHLVRGQRIDDGFAERLGALAGRDVVLVHQHTLLGSRWRGAAPDTESLAPLTRLRHRDLGERGAPVRLVAGSVEHRGLAVPLHRDGGIAFLSHHLDALMALRERTRAVLLALGSLLLVGGLWFAHRTASRLSRPISALANAADRMRDGDLTARAGLVQVDHEIERMSRSFDAMAETVQRLVADVSDKAERAEAANRAKDAFLTSISHELRTPLTGIQSTAELLQQFGAEASEAERDEFLTTILRESERLGQRIGDALEFAALAGGEAQWTLGRVDVRQCCAEATARLASLLELKRVAFVIDADADVAFVGDRERITQAVHKLVHNAWTWSPADGVVDVEVRGHADGCTIRILDRGPGVAAADRDRVFDTFAQGGDVLVDKPQGIGIGLKIAREVAVAHGGDIAYEDRPGGGACFVLRVAGSGRPIDRFVETLIATGGR
jgi:signal transduction histidine kinase